MTNIKKICVHSLLLILVFSHQPVFAAGKNKQALDGIAAVVNDTIITHTELNQAMETTKKQLQASNVTLPANDTIKKQVLEQMINKKLQLALADQMNVKVEDTEVDKTIEMLAKNNNVSVDELYKKVNEEGVTTAAYRKEIHDELTMQHVQQQAVGSKITITPQEVEKFIQSKEYKAFANEEYHLEDILITLPEAPSPQQVAVARKHAEELLVKIHNGLSFSSAAVAESGDKNALQGGDLGWRKLGEIPSAFASQIIHLKAKDIIGPVQTPNGFHILRLSEVRSVGKQPTEDEKRAQVQQLIFQRKLAEGLQSWITKLRSEAFINTKPESLA